MPALWVIALPEQPHCSSLVPQRAIWAMSRKIAPLAATLGTHSARARSAFTASPLHS